MTDMTIPAPGQGSTESAAPQVTEQPKSSVEPSPQAEKPAGEPQAQAPAGESEQTAASGEPPSQEEQPKSWKEKRQERNRQRWQEYKEAKVYVGERLRTLEAEVQRLRTGQQPDFSQITDPNEELAERTAWKVRQQQANDAEDRLRSERETASQVQQTAMDRAWGEAVEDARTRISDFDAVALAPSTAVHKNAVPYLVESEKGADVLYYLGKNPAEARSLYDKFAAGSPQALIELGRIEARISAPTPKTISTAPKPPPVLSGGVSPLGFDAKSAGVDDMKAELKKAGVLR